MESKGDKDTEYREILLERKPGYAVLTLNRPKANPLNRLMIEELERALGALARDRDVRALVITGAGDRVFSAGADLKAGTGEAGIFSSLRYVHQVFNGVENFRRPVIAALNGHALGGGCELALACHLRVMDRGATMGLVETNIGVIPGAGGTQRMARLVGRSRALEYMLLGRRLGAEEALAVGLVNRIADPGRALADAEELARELAGRAPRALAAVIRAVNLGLDSPLKAGLEHEVELFDEIIETRDAKEGIDAFLQGREPRYADE